MTTLFQTPQKIKENAIIEQLKQGSQKAFAEIYKTHKTHLTQYVQMRTLNTPLSFYTKDIVQDVLLKVQSKIALYNNKENTNFQNWLTIIAKNHIFDLQRKFKKNQTSPLYYENEEKSIDLILIDDSADIEDNQINLERSSLLNRLLEMNSLSDKQKKVAQMRYIEEQDYQSIADIMQIPLGSVKSILFTVHSELKKKVLNNTFLLKTLQ